MIDRLPPELLPATRNEFLHGAEHDLLTHMGFYLTWYAIVEVQITMILAYTLGFNSWPRAEIITRGMDARVKCERVRQATAKYKPMGQNLKNRLDCFEKDCIPLRNSIAHAWPLLDQKTRIVHFASFGKMPKMAQAETHEWEESEKAIHLDDLFSQAMWLNSFAGDLCDVMDSSVDGGELEIAHPKSGLPKEVLERLARKAQLAKSDKPSP